MSAPTDRLLLPPWALATGLVALTAAGWGWYRLAQPQPKLADLSPTEAPTGAVPLGTPVRTGEPAPVVVSAPDARGACTWLLRAPELAAVSDKGLMDHLGFLDASPLRVWRGEEALTVHTRGGDCDGGAAHGPLGVFVRPVDGDGSGPWRVQWTDTLEARPRRGPQGPQPLLWVVPGTTLTLPVEAGWSPSWGEPVVNLAGVASASAASVVLTWGDATVAIGGVGGPVRATLTGAPGAAASVLTITSPADGPALAISDLVVGLGPAATAVVGTLVGATAPLATDSAAAAGPQAVVTRAGSPPRSPVALGSVDAKCRAVIKRPDLEPVSDLRLFERFGWISASPVVVLEDGVALASHDRGEGCTGAIAHPPQGLVVRPSNGGEGHAYAIGWTEDVELKVGTKGQGKARIVWAVPGASTTWTFPAPLAEAPHDVVLDLVAFDGQVPGVLRQGDHEVSVAAGQEQRVAIPGPTEPGPFHITLVLPEAGPPVVVRGVEPRLR